jgi:hypothetical protein
MIAQAMVGRPLCNWGEKKGQPPRVRQEVGHLAPPVERNVARGGTG